MLTYPWPLGLPSSLKRPLLPTQTDDYGSTGIGDSKQDGPELEDDAELLLDSDEFAGEFLEPLALCEHAGHAAAPQE